MSCSCKQLEIRNSIEKKIKKKKINERKKEEKKIKLMKNKNHRVNLVIQCVIELCKIIYIK